MRKVVGTGETILDILFLQGQPVAAVPGGSSFNSIISTGRAGVPCIFVGYTGNDAVGRQTVEFMQHNGVSTDFFEVRNDEKSALSLGFLDEHGETVETVDPLAYPVLPGISGFTVVPPAKAVATGPDGVTLAVLDVDALATSSEDTFSGFKLANSGTLTVANVKSGAVVDISGCLGGLGNLEALLSWTLVCPDGPNGMSIAVRGSRVFLVPPTGLIMIVR